MNEPSAKSGSGPSPFVLKLHSSQNVSFISSKISASFLLKCHSDLPKCHSERSEESRSFPPPSSFPRPRKSSIFSPPQRGRVRAASVVRLAGFLYPSSGFPLKTAGMTMGCRNLCLERSRREKSLVQVCPTTEAFDFLRILRVALRGPSSLRGTSGEAQNGNNGQKVLGCFLGREGQKGRRAVGWIPAKSLREGQKGHLREGQKGAFAGRTERGICGKDRRGICGKDRKGICGKDGKGHLREGQKGHLWEGQKGHLWEGQKGALGMTGEAGISLSCQTVPR